MDKDALLNTLLYEDIEDEEVEELISGIDDPEVLHILAINYNWDDGYEIPGMILDNACCELSTALMLFYLAEGAEFLHDRKAFRKDKELQTFIAGLYSRIMKGNFKKGDILFRPPLGRVDLYYLKKALKEDEAVFIESFGTKEVKDTY